MAGLVKIKGITVETDPKDKVVLRGITVETKPVTNIIKGITVETQPPSGFGQVIRKK